MQDVTSSTCPEEDGCSLLHPMVAAYLKLEPATKHQPEKKAKGIHSRKQRACTSKTNKFHLLILNTKWLTEGEQQHILLLIREGEEVCRRFIGTSYLKGEESKEYGVLASDRIFLYMNQYVPSKRAKSRTLICAFALTQERFLPSDEGKYVYLDILCAREGSFLGSPLLSAVLEFYENQNRLNQEHPKDKYLFVEIRALPALVDYYVKKGFRWSSPRFKNEVVLLRGEDPSDGLHMSKML